MPADPWADLRARAVAAGAEDDALVAATLGYLAEWVIVERWTSRGMELALRRALVPDLGAASADAVLALLRPGWDAAIDLDPAVWERVLAERLMPEMLGLPIHLVQALRERWPPPPPITDRRQLEHETVSWSARELHLGRPSGIASVSLRWSDLVSLEAIDPYPRLLVEWGSPVSQLSFVLTGAGAAATIERLFDEAESRTRDEVVRRGWLDAEVVRWEPVEEWPDDAPEGAGAYRTAGSRSRVLARRPPRGGLRVMLQWLASTPARPFHAEIREALVTEHHLYARRRNGEMARLPLDTLRSRKGNEDAVYLFGRDERVLLTDRRSCDVCHALDARLREQLGFPKGTPATRA